MEKIIKRYDRIGYNLNVMLQSACLALNPITVNNYTSLLNCMPVGRALDSMMAQHKAIYFSWLGTELFRLLLGPQGYNSWFSFTSDLQWCC